MGHNYRNHIKEMGREVPEFPTLFAKYQESLIGPNDDLALPQESDTVDWEAELAVVIGKKGRRISEADAADHIAGYAVLNDVSMRDYQFRTIQWLQGKTWEKSTPFGPALVTKDVGHRRRLLDAIARLAGGGAAARTEGEAARAPRRSRRGRLLSPSGARSRPCSATSSATPGFPPISIPRSCWSCSPATRTSAPR